MSFTDLSTGMSLMYMSVAESQLVMKYISGIQDKRKLNNNQHALYFL